MLRRLLLSVLFFFSNPSLLMTTSMKTRQMAVGMPGSYNSADVTDPRVVAAAQCAMQSLGTSPYPQLSLPSSSPSSTLSNGSFIIVEVSQQVVAGMNYRLKIQVSDGQQRCVGVFQVTVYDHFGDLSVTEWGEANIPCLPPVNSVTDPLAEANTSDEQPDQ